MARLIIPQRLELFVVTTQSTISRECLCQRPVRKVLQRRASRTAVIRHRQLSSTECTIASDTDACTRSLSISRMSRGDGQRPSCSRAMKRGGSWHISPTCQTYESPTSNFPVGSRSIAVRARHAPVIICLVESNPPRPTRLRPPERRLRRNQGLSRHTVPISCSPRQCASCYNCISVL